MRVVVVNSGVGNVRAIPNMLKRLGATAEISGDPETVAAAECLILPGVGSFDAALRRFRAAGLAEALNQKVTVERTPLLGICVGMQLMAESSEEGDEAGFGWIQGRFLRLRPNDGGAKPIRVPHMGWNLVHNTRHEPLYAGMEDEARFYFNHSYYLIPENEAELCGVTQHGVVFAAGVRRDNLYGVQFHPEKSHRFGLKLLENFLEIASRQ